MIATTECSIFLFPHLVSLLPFSSISFFSAQAIPILIQFLINFPSITVCLPPATSIVLVAVTSFPGSLRDQVCPYQSAPDGLISLATLGHLVILLPCTDPPHASSQCVLHRSEQGHAAPGEKQAGACRDEGPQSSSSASKSPSPKASLCKLGVKKALVCCLWKRPSLRQESSKHLLSLLAPPVQ